MQPALLSARETSPRLMEQPIFSGQLAWKGGKEGLETAQLAWIPTLAPPRGPPTTTRSDSSADGSNPEALLGITPPKKRRERGFGESLLGDMVPTQPWEASKHLTT